MTIQQVYDHFEIPPGLRTHMVRVAQFVDVLHNYWAGPAVDRQRLVTCALVHDLGNIVRFVRWFDEDAPEREHWERVKASAIARYGIDDHEVTRQMLESIKADPQIIKTVLAKSSHNAPLIAAGNDWPLKLLLYADFRITPQGVGSLEHRLQEIAERSDKHRKMMFLIEASRSIEQQIQALCTHDIRAIREADFMITRDALLLMNV